MPYIAAFGLGNFPCVNDEINGAGKYAPAGSFRLIPGLAVILASVLVCA